MVQDQFVVVVVVAVRSWVIDFWLRVYDLSFRTASSRFLLRTPIALAARPSANTQYAVYFFKSVGVALHRWQCNLKR